MSASAPSLSSAPGPPRPTESPSPASLDFTKPTANTFDYVPSVLEDQLALTFLKPDVLDNFIPEQTLLTFEARFMHGFPVLLLLLEKLVTMPDKHTLYKRFLDTLRVRITSSRTTKLLFLLATRTHQHIWKVNLVYQPGCYNSDQLHREKLATLLADPATAASLKAPSSTLEAPTSDRLLNDDQLLLDFAVTQFFHPRKGVKLTVNPLYLFVNKVTFVASHGVEWIMARLGLSTRADAIAILEQFRKRGLIECAVKKKVFEDGDKLWYKMFEVRREGEELVGEIEGTHEKFVSTRDPDKHFAIPERRIEMTVPVDLVDLQSLEFWSKDVFVEAAATKGFNFGYRLVSHPLLLHTDLADHQKLTEQLQDAPRREIEKMISSVTSMDDTFSVLSMPHDVTDGLDRTVVSNVVVEHVFSSIARPFIISMRKLRRNAIAYSSEGHDQVGPKLIVKKGDNLHQDMAVETTFSALDIIWRSSPDIFPDRSKVPFIYTYAVIPTSAKEGLIEVVNGVTSFKDYDWEKWSAKYRDDPSVRDEMVRSAAGAYIGAYFLGCRDRHWDNILIRNDCTLLHIDFGFILGAQPPIDGPRFSISPAMHGAFQKEGLWTTFLDTACKAFLCLRRNAGTVVRAAMGLFANVGFDPNQVREYLMGRKSLNMAATEEEAVNKIRRLLESSSTDWKTILKAYSHDNVDPVFYGLLEKGFPPAVLAMKVVDYNHDRQIASPPAAQAKENKDSKEGSSFTKLFAGMRS